MKHILQRFGLIFCFLLTLLVSSLGVQAQEAVPPSPPQGVRYRNLDIDLGDGWISKAQLTYPETGSGPWPTVILQHGGGPLDMDETIWDGPGAPIRSTNFRFIAEQFGKSGIAVMRVDKRGVYAYDNIDFAQYGKTDVNRQVADTESILAATLAQSEVDATRVFMYGVSYGSWVAAVFAASHPEIAGLILQGADGATYWSETNEAQNTMYLDYMQTTLDADKDSKLSLQEFGAIPAGSIGYLLTGGILAADSTPEQPKFSSDVDQNNDGLADIEGEVAPYLTAILEDYIATDLDRLVPSTVEAVTTLTIPVLVLQGENDGLIAPINGERLKAAAPDNVTLNLYPGLGHVLSKTTIPAEDAFNPIEQQPVDDMIAWILAHTQ